MRRIKIIRKFRQVDLLEEFQQRWKNELKKTFVSVADENIFQMSFYHFFNFEYFVETWK